LRPLPMRMVGGFRQRELPARQILPHSASGGEGKELRYGRGAPSVAMTPEISPGGRTVGDSF
jgi:hypothetical protein